MLHIYYTKLLHVSAIYPSHLQGVKRLVDMQSFYGNLLQISNNICRREYDAQYALKNEERMLTF
jgi:hypothetical protein